MKVLVCGGRDFTDYPFFRDKMEEIALARFPRMDADEYGNFLYKVTIISGGAKGAAGGDFPCVSCEGVRQADAICPAGVIP